MWRFHSYVCDVTRKSASIPCFMARLWSIVYVCRFPIDNKENTVREYIQETSCLHVGQKTKNVYVPLEVTDNFFVETKKVIYM